MRLAALATALFLFASPLLAETAAEKSNAFGSKDSRIKLIESS